MVLFREATVKEFCIMSAPDDHLSLIRMWSRVQSADARKMEMSYCRKLKVRGTLAACW